MPGIVECGTQYDSMMTTTAINTHTIKLSRRRTITGGTRRINQGIPLSEVYHLG